MGWIFPLSLLILFEIFADIFAKEYSLKDHWYFWLGSLLCYVLANIFWLYAIKHGSGLTRGANIFSVSTAVIATFIGVYIYKESISSIQIIGVVLGVFSLICIFWE